MCSVSWVRRRGSLVVVMNRDERRDRAPARPPRRWRGADGGFTAPVDAAAGGTWIAARDSGVVLALLNHHASSGTAPPAGAIRVSRGRLVTALAAEAGVPDAARLRAEDLASLAPFRLFVIGPRLAPRVFTWTGAALSSRRLDPQVGFLTSSSWNPRGVIAARQAQFRAFRRAAGRPTLAALIAFHDQAASARGPGYAVRMSRADARTVSRTVVEWRAGRVSMAYQACPDAHAARSAAETGS
jgi:hypothetical protein